MSQKFRSKFEKEVSKYVPRDSEYEKVRIEYVQRKQYIPDWRLRDGTYLEAKGRFTSADRGKHLCIQQQCPGVKVRFVFQNPDVRIARNSKTTYGEWCDKHGFEWCKGPKLPKEWVE